ncbi:Hypothetical predicted protein [Pelobates cultripes]|uniref:Uncharacterized protein n=1 Tax=Pelobates cultripes TaxID=61616 RepID=A0AAD1RJE2_PELCU|nr:Hypothetical predicted protein [Pelobates cultripes]
MRQKSAERNRCTALDCMLQHLDKVFAQFWEQLEVRAPEAAGGQRSKWRGKYLDTEVRPQMQALSKARGKQENKCNPSPDLSRVSPLGTELRSRPATKASRKVIG